MSWHYNIKYQPAHAMSDKNKYIEEYYTSVDTDIFVNNTPCNYISVLQYSLQEQLLPIYGYNSYIYDDVAIGNRIVIGSMKIPVTNYSQFIKELNGSNTSNSRATDVDQKTSVPSWVTDDRNYIPVSEYESIISDMYNSGMFISIDSIHSNEHRINSRINEVPAESIKSDENIENSTQASINIPKYNRSDTTFFETEYNKSNLENDIANKNTMRKNHVNIVIQISDTHKRELVDVIFRGVDTEYNAETGEAIYEVIQFVAKDLIEDGVNSDSDNSTNNDDSNNTPPDDSSSGNTGSGGSGGGTNTQLPL